MVADIFYADGQRDEQTDRQTDRLTGRHDEANSRFSQFWELSYKEATHGSSMASGDDGSPDVSFCQLLPFKPLGRI